MIEFEIPLEQFDVGETYPLWTIIRITDNVTYNIYFNIISKFPRLILRVSYQFIVKIYWKRVSNWKKRIIPKQKDHIRPCIFSRKENTYN